MQEMKSQLRKNIFKFYLSSFFGGWAFALGFLTFYYREVGFSYFQIFLVAVLYEGLNFLLEIPTGVLADLWSRKWTITLGHTISGLSFLVVMLRPEAYEMYLLWSVLSAIATTLNSGTVMAIVYDSLRGTGNEDQFAKVQSRTFAIGLLTQTVAYISGGYLADLYDFRLVLLLSGIGGLLQATILSSLREPPLLEDVNGDGYHVDRYLPWWKQLLQQMRASFEIMFKRTRVRWVLGYGFFVFVMYEFFRIVTQPYLKDLGYDSRFAISIFSAGFAFVTAWASIATGRFKTEKNEAMLTGLSAIGITVPFIFLGILNGTAGIAALIIYRIALGAADVLVPEMLNRLIPSDRRATILSAQNQLNSLGYAIIAIILGSLMDKFGLHSTILMVGILSTVLLITLRISKPKPASTPVLIPSKAEPIEVSRG